MKLPTLLSGFPVFLWKLTLIACACGLRTAQGMDHQHDFLDGSLPEAPEKVEIMKFCVACHGIERVQHSGGTDAGWQDRIQRMVRWGAQIPPERIVSVAAYLAKALPLRPRPAASLTYFANTAVREVAVEDIQRTMRLAARPAAGGDLRVEVGSDAAALLAVGQRARVFALETRSVMIPATVVRLDRRPGGYEAMLRTARPMASASSSTAYLAEVVINGGRFLAVPNDAIIDDGGRQRVYVQDAAGEYASRAVELGIQGDQMTQVAGGLFPGERVVTLGAFFIDAEQRMNLP
jgi:hypothetical protein